MTNWPNEPPALTMPVASPRRSGGDQPRGRAISTAGPAMPAPPAASTPIAKIRPAVVVMYGVMKVPSATSSTPSEQHPPGADLVGHGAGERLRQAPPQLAEGERQADAAQAQAGGVLSG